MHDLIRQRLSKEQGTLLGQGRRAIALVYPSPYGVGMSSLGYQAVYGQLNRMHDTVAERAFLPDTDPKTNAPAAGPLLTYESQRPAGDFPVIAFSVAYELEITGVFTCLTRMGIPLLRSERAAGQHTGSKAYPWVVMGGPLTFSNPAPLAPFADVIVMGEAEDLLQPLCDALFSSGMSRDDVLRSLADLPGFYVPELHGEVMPKVAACDNAQLPACSSIITPDMALSNMFLIETERGCSRGCTFCVMRRSTNGGMRVVPVERILSAIPDHATRVGLVGAAVSDHPRIVQIVRGIAERGMEVGLSSLRADRLTPEFVEALVLGGYRTLTVASDGASERLRDSIEKRTREKHLLRVAELARAAEMPQLKIYMMLGVPGETDADIDELIAFTLQQAEIAGHKTKVSLGVATFVAKRNTPLDGAPFVGIKEADRRIDRLRRGLAPRVEVRPISSRWAWVEYVMAQSGSEAGLKALQAWRDGGSFAAWRRAFHDHMPDRAKSPQRRLSLLSQEGIAVNG